MKKYDSNLTFSQYKQYTELLDKDVSAFQEKVRLDDPPPPSSDSTKFTKEKSMERRSQIPSKVSLQKTIMPCLAWRRFKKKKQVEKCRINVDTPIPVRKPLYSSTTTERNKWCRRRVYLASDHTPLRLYFSYYEPPEEEYVTTILDAYGKPVLKLSEQDKYSGMVYDKNSFTLLPPIEKPKIKSIRERWPLSMRSVTQISLHYRAQKERKRKEEKKGR
ncbi:unnamed protein product [Dimorphilus gyrociliatus]|uniref:Uncharacterized protein n=1 Tax=Dimorphilus gyrociliatus TaxID=2664684 RepID=A0A7I8V9S6_9ANNE|nr:unnamed protein product [Dimorphilus gyrociliatus]